MVDSNEQAEARAEQAPGGVDIIDGRTGYDTRTIRTYDDASSVGKAAYDHAKRRLSRWQEGDAHVSGVTLDQATQARMLANIQICLKKQGYEGELLTQQSEMLLYKLVQANLLYHPRESVMVEGQKRKATEVMGDHRALLKGVASTDMGQATPEQIDQMGQDLMRVEAAVSDRGHAILGVHAGQGRSFNTSKTSGYTETSANRQITAEEQAALDRAIFEAVKRGDVEAINQAVRLGGNLNATDEEGRTPLDLLDEIIDDKELDDKKLTPEQVKAYEELRSGMRRAKALSQDDQEDLQEELLNLVKEGKVAEANELIKNSRSLTYNAVANGYEMTHLMVALDEDKPEMAMNILNSGVDVNAQDEDGNTALHYVARMDADDVPLETRLQLMQKLIEQGANVNAVDENGRTVMDLVNDMDEDEGQKEMKALLERHGGLEAHNALFTAIRDGDLKTVEALVKGGVDIDTTEKGTGYGVMHFGAICQKNQEQMCQLLMELGADPEEAAKGDITPMHVAAQVGNVAFAQALIKHGNVDVNAEDDKDRTALHIAAGVGHNGMVQVLLQNGADANAKDDDDKTPMDYANETGNQQGAGLLASVGGKAQQASQAQAQPVPQPQPLAQAHSGGALHGAGNAVPTGTDAPDANGYEPGRDDF